MLPSSSPPLLKGEGILLLFQISFSLAPILFPHPLFRAHKLLTIHIKLLIFIITKYNRR